MKAPPVLGGGWAGGVGARAFYSQNPPHSYANFIGITLLIIATRY
jgi:hypothetical protein